MSRCKTEKAHLTEEIEKVSDWLESRGNVDQSESVDMAGVDEVDAIMTKKDVDNVEKSLDMLSVCVFGFVNFILRYFNQKWYY